MPKAGLKFVSPPAAVLSFVAPSVTIFGPQRFGQSAHTCSPSRAVDFRRLVTRGSRQDRPLMRSGMGRAKGSGWRQGERQRAGADRPCARAGGQEGRAPLRSRASAIHDGLPRARCKGRLPPGAGRLSISGKGLSAPPARGRRPFSRKHLSAEGAPAGRLGRACARASGGIRKARAKTGPVASAKTQNRRRQARMMIGN
jgi:hypothetical protein